MLPLHMLGRLGDATSFHIPLRMELVENTSIPQINVIFWRRLAAFALERNESDIYKAVKKALRRRLFPKQLVGVLRRNTTVALRRKISRTRVGKITKRILKRFIGCKG
jgi:hypothetical protein